MYRDAHRHAQMRNEVTRDAPLDLLGSLASDTPHVTDSQAGNLLAPLLLSSKKRRQALHTLLHSVRLLASHSVTPENAARPAPQSAPPQSPGPPGVMKSKRDQSSRRLFWMGAPDLGRGGEAGWEGGRVRQEPSRQYKLMFRTS